MPNHGAVGVKIMRGKLRCIFSFGRILYQLLLREIPFYDWSGANMSVDIINGAEPNYDRIPGIRRSLIDALDEDLAFFDLLKNYMDKCCDRDVNKRPSMPTSTYSNCFSTLLHSCRPISKPKNDSIHQRGMFTASTLIAQNITVCRCA